MSGTIALQLSLILSCLVGVAFPQSECQSKVCNADEVCAVQDGNEICVSAFGSYCWIVGDPHYKPFDGAQYDFEGNCYYTISKSTSLDDGLIPFNIEARNENRGNSKVSFVGLVRLYVYNNKIVFSRQQRGFAQVNNQISRLPLSLDNKVTITQSGHFAYVATDFLKLYYDWNSVMIIQLSKQYLGKVEGMCGSYQTLDGAYIQKESPLPQLDAIAIGKSFATPESDTKCWHDCHGPCTQCPEDKKYETNCQIILAEKGPFSGCHNVVDPQIFYEYCVNDQCISNGAKYILCQSLHSYKAICQIKGAKIGEWRRQTACSMGCPANSVYKLCGNACPKTCNDDITQPCSMPCLETCECRQGYVLDGGKCVPQANCGCVSNGRIYSPNETFWDDPSCTRKCKCEPDTRTVVCFSETCKKYEKCAVVRGIQTCQSLSNGTCAAYGDPHFRTFDKVNYDFQGVCVYLFSGLRRNGTGLEDFQVYIKNKNRGNRAVSYVHVVKVRVYNLEIILNSYYVDTIKVNGLFVNFPYVVGLEDVSIYKSGFDAVIETKFGLRITYNWQGYLLVTVPGVYGGTLGGLCGNFDGNANNDFETPDQKLVPNPNDFGKNWTVEYDPPDCNTFFPPICLELKQIIAEHRNKRIGCGILLDKNGPFKNCHAKVAPEPLFNDCAYDACFYHGRLDAICQVVTSYATICLANGITVDPWRSDLFCDVLCPPNSHYRVCAPDCQPTCASYASPLGCTPGCAKGCVCDDGYLLSGNDCVTPDECGCTYEGLYYKSGSKFLTKECTESCTCEIGGNLNCKVYSCALNETCSNENGHLTCIPLGPPRQCFVSGDSKYQTLDGVTYDFEGNCAYVLSASTPKPGLPSFAVYLNNERYGKECMAISKSVALEVYGHTLILQHNRGGFITVDGVLYNMPFKEPDGKIDAYFLGINSFIVLDTGLILSYDHYYSLVLTVPLSYKRSVEGLCGNYNNDIKDEFNQTQGEDSSTFGNYWKVQPPYWDIDINCNSSARICSPCSSQIKQILGTETYCGFLNKPNGPLSDCYTAIVPDDYFKNCKKALCELESEAKWREKLCQIIQSYVLACQAAGAKVLPWRNETSCSPDCGKHSHYSICSRGCPELCKMLSDPGQCPATCIEGCECDDQYYFDGEGCVSMENCGCYIDGRYYKDGQQYLTQGCSKLCTCKSGYISCQSRSCSSDEECLISNEALVCNRTSWTCSINSGRLVTFDNQTYELGSNHFYFSFYCNPSSSSWFRIIAAVYRCGSEPLAVGKIHIYTIIDWVSLTREGKAWKRGLPINLDVKNPDPVRISSQLSMRKLTDGVEVHIGEHLQILLTTDGSLKLRSTDFYLGKLCGLCGNPKWISEFPKGLRTSVSGLWVAEESEGWNQAAAGLFCTQGKISNVHALLSLFPKQIMSLKDKHKNHKMPTAPRLKAKHILNKHKSPPE